MEINVSADTSLKCVSLCQINNTTQFQYAFPCTKVTHFKGLFVYVK